MDSVLHPAAALRLITAASAIVLGGALLSQYWGGLEPCALCFIQRWPYAGVIALGAAVALIVRDPDILRLTLAVTGAFLAIGTAVALYHVGVEEGVFAGPAACTAGVATPDSVDALRAMLAERPIVRCDQPAWTLFGVSMAGYNAIAGGAMAVFALASAARNHTSG